MSTTTVVPPLLLLVLCCLFSSQIITGYETGISPAAAPVDHPLHSQERGGWFRQRLHDQILKLPGQPEIQSFEQYSGYVTVDEKAGRALFYYFVEAADPSFKNSAPLLLWLNGGPGCSSLGRGAMSEIGPFRVKSDGKTLYNNDFSWNKVANVLFLESPVGVGFSYSNTSTDIKRNNDNNTAADTYVFLLNWMERFPEYKGRDFYIVGESYGGHYVPQLAHTILEENYKYGNSKIINLKGIGLGNPWLEEEFGGSDFFEYLWSHAMISDKVIENIRFICDFTKPYKNRSKECYDAMNPTLDVAGRDVYHRYNIYAPLCHSNSTTIIPKDTSLTHFDPCNDVYVHHYLNLAEVQLALHAKFTSWAMIRNPNEIYNNTKFFESTLSLLSNVMANGVPILVYSGDFDAVVPFLSTKTVLKRLNLTEVVQWNTPWKSDDEVAGYHVVYQGGLTFTTIKGAGHMVPSDQAKRALAMISIFLRGEDFV